MNGAPVRCALVISLQAVALFATLTASAQVTLRPQPADEASTPLPAGWKSIDRGLYDAYANALATGQAGQSPGGLKRATYRLKLEADGSLTGEFEGTIHLTGEPALVPLGKPSFAITDLELDGETPAWGCDSQGVSRLLCPRDDATLRFQCSQQGIRRGDSIEFNLDWLMSVATQLQLTVPASQAAEAQGLLKIGQKSESDGSITSTYEAGARSNCTIRIRPQPNAAPQSLGVELRQTLSATPTKVLLQSIIGILSTTSAPAFAEFDLPPGFTLSRATLGGDERLLINPPGTSGPLRIPLGELSAGQRIELRLVMERPADWHQPLSVPRVAPRNGVLLREELSLQIERPLEILDVQAPDYELTALSVEPAREVWTWQGVSPHAALNLTVRAPTADWSADCFVKRRQQDPRSELVTLVDLKSQKSPLFEFDVDIARPWKIVSVTAPDAAGNPLPLTFQTLEESDRFARHRILLRVPATPQKGTTVVIAVAAQKEHAGSAAPQPVAIPRGGRVENYLLLDPTPETSQPGSSVQLSSLRSGLRTHSFFEPVRTGAAALYRTAGSGSIPDAIAPLARPPADPIPAVNPNSDPPLTPLKDALAVAELQTLIGTESSPSSHRATFVFDDPVDVSGETVRFDGDWTLIEVLGDGAPIRAVVQGRELRLPESYRGVREIVIRYTTRAAGSGIPRRDRVDWPQLTAQIQAWNWRVEAPLDRRVTSIDAPFEFASGVMRPGLRERLFAPLARTTGAPIFNPFRTDCWRDLLNPSSGTREEAPRDRAFVAAIGREYPTATSIVSWSDSLLRGLNWVLFVGAMLVVTIVRRFKRGTFRFAAALSALAATAAWLLPPPFGSMAGSIFGGNLLAYCVPRRVLAPHPALTSRPAGSSIVQFAGATAMLIAAAQGPALLAVAQSPSLSPNVLVLERDAEPAPVVFVSEAVAADIADWQLDRFGPPFLIRGARYDVAVDETDLASADLEFDIVVPRPDVTRTVQLPIDGLTFRGPDAARIDGELAKIVPAAEGTGVLLSLPGPPEKAPATPASYRVQLAAGIRTSSAGMRREFAITVPRCSSAVGALRSAAGKVSDVRSSCRGRTEVSTRSIECSLGAIGRWHVRWRAGDPSERSTSESSVAARAESVVTVDPQVLAIQTRLICETPELPDPFASTRLEVLLPPRSIVSSVTGQTLVAWTTRPEDEGLRVLLDFASPPIVGQVVDLQYELPILPAPLVEIPPIPVLAGSRLSSHQIAVATNPAFQLEMLTRPDPNTGVWAVEPGEASFSLRKDRGLPIPVAALEFESRPAPLSLAFHRRPTGRVAELEQSLSSQSDSLSWTGTARLETSVRPGFLYEFRVDPAVEITAASVVDRDVERLSRFVREGDRLLLVVGDDRLGTKNVRLEGRLRLETGKARPIPRFDLDETVITRREIVITSSSDQLIQVRRSNNAPVLVAQNEAEWEPQSPSSLRVSLPTGHSNYEMRWINPASPLRLVEFLRLPDDEASAWSIEWQLASSQPLPAALAIDAPRGTQIVDQSDFTEENRRPLPGDRIRIELQSKSSRLAEARIELTAPVHTGANQDGHIPALADIAVQPVTWLAVPRKLLARYEIPGDFLDQLPPESPAEWRPPFQSRDLLVFRLTARDWDIATTAGPGSIGEATAEILASDSPDGRHGLTRLLITPSRAAVLGIEPPPRGTLHALRASPGTLLEKEESGNWSLLLRPSQPVAVVMDWTIPASDEAATHFGPLTPGLEVQVSYNAVASIAQPAPWTPEILARPQAADTLAAIRLESLLAAARRLPIGVRPPGWLRDELQELARTNGETRNARHLAIQAEGLLESWSTGANSTTLPSAIAPTQSLVGRTPEQALAQQMLAAAADPELVIKTPPGRQAWSMSRRVFNAAFITVWLIFWAFLVTKGGQWAARNQLADRLARHPGALLVGIGLAWWLLLTPGVLGIVLAAAGLIWELSSWSYHRTTQPPAPAI